MKPILTISILLNVLGLSVFAYHRIAPERIVNDKTYQHARTDVFKSMPKDSGSVIFLGNSITEGFPVSELFGAKNRGVSGAELEDIYNRLGEVVSRKPSKVFIMAGINDIRNNAPLHGSLLIYRMILDSLKRSGTTVYIQSVLPVSFKDMMPKIKEFNDSIKNYGNYIDLYSHFIDGNVINPALTYDGLHLTGKGYELWASLIAYSIGQRLYPSAIVEAYNKPL